MAEFVYFLKTSSSYSKSNKKYYLFYYYKALTIVSDSF